MAKYKKSSSSPWVLIVPLAIAIVVVLSAAILSQRAAYTRSKASYDPVQACVNFCNTPPKYGINLILNPAACALDCPAVTQGETACKNFCNENVKRVTNQHPNPTQQARLQTPGASLPNSISACNQACNTWTGNPCAAQGAVCKEALGVKRDQAKAQCATSCELVKEEEYACDEVMTTASLSAVNASLRPKVLKNCKTYFE